MKKIIVSVINDLVTDQRVNRTCSVLHEIGYDVLLVGRVLPNSLPMDDRPYQVKRMKLIFTKGAFFYAEFNIRLFLMLLLTRTDELFSNDLDTLLPNTLISILKRKKLHYDAHEYFTEVPELVHRPRIQRVWKSIEKFTVSRLSKMITVNQSIANLYEEDYALNCTIVRNVPLVFSQNQSVKKSRLLILQGAGINMDRGGEELIEAMKQIDAVLWVVGDGDALPKLKSMVKLLEIGEKVIFKGKVPLAELRKFTAQAQIGFTLDKDTNINYRYSLPNKIFDYMHAGCAIISSPLIEVERVVKGYQVGLVLREVSPEEIIEKVNALLGDEDRLSLFQHNTIKASEELNWNKEKLALIDFLN